MRQLILTLKILRFKRVNKKVRALDSLGGHQTPEELAYIIEIIPLPPAVTALQLKHSR